MGLLHSILLLAAADGDKQSVCFAWPHTAREKIRQERALSGFMHAWLCTVKNKKAFLSFNHC